MTDDKTPPRSWWIVDGREGERLFDDEHEAIIYAGRLAEDDPTFTIRVVDARDYDRVLALKDEYQKQLEDNEWRVERHLSERIAKLEAELAEAKHLAGFAIGGQWNEIPKLRAELAQAREWSALLQRELDHRSAFAAKMRQERDEARAEIERLKAAHEYPPFKALTAERDRFHGALVLIAHQVSTASTMKSIAREALK